MEGITILETENLLNFVYDKRTNSNEELEVKGSNDIDYAYKVRGYFNVLSKYIEGYLHKISKSNKFEFKFNFKHVKIKEVGSVRASKIMPYQASILDVVSYKKILSEAITQFLSDASSMAEFITKYEGDRLFFTSNIEKKDMQGYLFSQNQDAFEFILKLIEIGSFEKKLHELRIFGPMAEEYRFPTIEKKIVDVDTDVDVTIDAQLIDLSLREVKFQVRNSEIKKKNTAYKNEIEIKISVASLSKEDKIVLSEIGINHSVKLSFIKIIKSICFEEEWSIRDSHFLKLEKGEIDQRDLDLS